MRPLTTLGRLLAVLGLAVAVIGLGASASDAKSLTRTCSHPKFVLSGHEGGQSIGRYYADNNMWNAGGYDVSQSMRVCSPGNWSVTARADNSRGDGAVKTYPNVHRDYHNWGNGHEPKLSAFKSLKSRFASRSPHVGIYNGAYDIWMNGVGGGADEVMIWTDNYRQTPGGHQVAKGLKFSHRTWKLYSDGHGYLAFLPNRPVKQGVMNLKARLAYLVKHGYLPKGSTVGQVDFGYEIVSTNGTPQKFKIDRFKVMSSRR